MKKKADEFEGRDIMWYINHPDELERWMENINDDELTAGRIRSIYVRVRYGHERASDVAKYYDLPVSVVNDIGNGKLFGNITNNT